MIAIRDAVPSDAEAICAIYNHHVRETIVTFEETDVTADEMRARILGITAIYPWLVVESGGKLIGYAYGAKFHERAGYRPSVVTTIYVAEGSHRRGVGTTLYLALLERLREHEFHAAIGVIALPNDASIAVHEKCGFTKVGHLLEVGMKFGRWIDVGYWQLLLG